MHIPVCFSYNNFRILNISHTWPSMSTTDDFVVQNFRSIVAIIVMNALNIAAIGSVCICYCRSVCITYTAIIIFPISNYIIY